MATWADTFYSALNVALRIAAADCEANGQPRAVGARFADAADVCERAAVRIRMPEAAPSDG